MLQQAATLEVILQDDSCPSINPHRQHHGYAGATLPTDRSVLSGVESYVCALDSSAPPDPSSHLEDMDHRIRLPLEPFLSTVLQPVVSGWPSFPWCAIARPGEDRRSGATSNRDHAHTARGGVVLSNRGIRCQEAATLRP